VQVDGHIKGNCRRRTVNCQSVRVWDVPNGVQSVESLSQL